MQLQDMLAVRNILSSTSGSWKEKHWKFTPRYSLCSVVIPQALPKLERIIFYPARGTSASCNGTQRTEQHH